MSPHRALACCLATAGITLVSQAAANDISLADGVPVYIGPSAQFATADVAGAGYRLDALRTGRFGSPSDFAGMAQVVFKTQKRPMVRSTALAIGALNPLPTGWHMQGDIAFWREQHQLPGAAFVMSIAPPARDFRLSDYEEVWVDYQSVGGLPLCTPHLSLGLRAGPGQDRVLLAETGVAQVHTRVATIDASKAAWRAKGLGYVALRELGLAGDEDWYYAQDGPNAVLQRRMHQSLDGIDAVQVIAAPGVRIVHVNLRVVASDSALAGVVIEYPNVSDALSVGGGRNGVTLDVQAALTTRFAREIQVGLTKANGPSFFLTEVSVFVAGESRRVAEAQPLERIDFLSPAWDGSDGNLSPPGRLATIPGALAEAGKAEQRFVADLRPLARYAKQELSAGRLTLFPPKGSTACAARVRQVRAAAPYSEVIPVYASDVELWTRRWVDSSVYPPPSPGEVDVPKILAHFSFAGLEPAATGRAESREYKLQLQPSNDLKITPVAAKPAGKPYRILDEKGNEISGLPARLLSSNGATLRAEESLPYVAAPANALQVQGSDGNLEIAWPVEVHLSSSTLFFVGVPEGAEQLAETILSLELRDGSVIRRRVVPNRSQNLSVGDVDVRSLRLRLIAAAAPFRMTLSEMALFEPTREPFARTASLAVPTAYTIVPKIVFEGATREGVIESRDGKVVGLIAAFTKSHALRFSTPLNPSLAMVRGLRLQFAMPMQGREEASCPLAVLLEWSRARQERRICFNSSAGNVYVPIADIIGRVTEPLGDLTSIKWAVEFGDEVAAVPGHFELSILVEGWTKLSPLDHLWLTPLVDLGGRGVYADVYTIDSQPAGEAPSMHWVPLTRDGVARILTTSGPIQAADNRLLSVQQIILKPTSALSAGQLTKLAHGTPRNPVQGPSWWPWILAAATLTVLWFVFRKRQFVLVERHAAGVRRLIAKARHFFSIRLHGSWREAQLFAIVAAALPTLWLAGHLGTGYAGIMLVIAALIFLRAAYFHWSRAAAHTMPYAYIVVGAGCAIWSLGRSGISRDSLWGFAPFLGALYLIAPSAFCVLTGMQWRSPWTLSVIWGVLAGILLAVSDGKILGILAAATGVVGIRYLLEGILAVLPWSRRSAECRHGALFFLSAAVLVASAAVATLVRKDGVAEALSGMAYLAVLLGAATEVWRKLRERRASMPPDAAK